MRQQLEGLFSKSDEDHAADQADRVAQQAYETAEECAVGASELEEALTEVVTQARDLRKRISSGLVSEKDAREALAHAHAHAHAQRTTHTALRAAAAANTPNQQHRTVAQAGAVEGRVLRSSTAPTLVVGPDQCRRLGDSRDMAPASVLTVTSSLAGAAKIESMP